MKKIILAAAAALLMTSVTACTPDGQLSNQAVSVVAQDVAIIANGLQGTIPALNAAGVIPAEKVAGVSQAIANLQALSSALATTASLSAAQPIVQQVELDVNAIVSALVGIKGLPQNVTLALVAAQVLLPVVETAVGMVISTPPKAVHYAMSPNEARAILIGQASHR